MKGMFAASLFAVFGFAVPAQTQEVSDCDWRSSAASLLEPWDDHSRTFAKGDVRIALLDTIEPGTAPLHLLLLSPPFDELGARQCKVLSHQRQRGFADANFSTLESAYDPVVGLIFTLKVRVIEAEEMSELILRFTLNQATGVIEASLE